MTTRRVGAPSTMAASTMTASTMAASTLCRDLLVGPRTPLTPAHRSREAWLLTAPDPARWVCLSTPRAVLLPHALVLGRLPPASSAISAGDGFLWYDDHPVAVRRWLTPSRVARGCLAGHPNRRDRLAGWLPGWSDLLGRGEGLTPYSDDVICGVLLGLIALDDPRADWLTGQLRDTDLAARTTAVSGALLRAAGEGWCIPEVASVVTALSSGREAAPAVRRLLAVGHSSGHGLWAGLSTVLETPTLGFAA